MNRHPIKFVCNVVIPSLVALTSIATAATERTAYSYNGSITPDELAAMQSLAWPQSYSAITGRFGYPAQRSSHADWYLRPGGMGAVRVDYDQNNIAISMTLEGN
jgi:hypothetical protein